MTETAELVHVFVGEEEIRTTEFHPFFVEGEGWKAAGELAAGDVLRTEDGKERTAGRVEVERLSVPVKVYNLEIEDSHVYYVSGAGVLVHNECPNPNGKKGGNEHQSKINDIEPTAIGGELRYEEMYDTNGGHKNKRYADVVEVVDGIITRIYQVGKANKNGLPITRESRAIEDIMNSSKYNGAPIFFIPYNIDLGEIIY